MTIVVFPPAGIGILPVSQLPDARVIMLASLGVRLVSLLGLLLVASAVNLLLVLVFLLSLPEAAAALIRASTIRGESACASQYASVVSRCNLHLIQRDARQTPCTVFLHLYQSFPMVVMDLGGENNVMHAQC